MVFPSAYGLPSSLDNVFRTIALRWGRLLLSLPPVWGRLLRSGTIHSISPALVVWLACDIGFWSTESNVSSRSYGDVDTVNWDIH